MAGVLRFCTSQCAPKDRVSYWSDEIWQRIGGIETTTFNGEALEARLTVGAAGPVQLCRLRVGPHRIGRTPQHVRSEGSQWLKIVFQLRGELFIEQGDRRARLRPGHWCIYDVGMPYNAYNVEPIDMLALLVSRQAVSSRVFDASVNLLKPVSWQHGVSRVLYDSVRASLRSLDTVAAEVSEDLGISLLELAKLAMYEKVETFGALSSRERVRERITAYVERQLHDPELSIDKIARSMNCTKRYLHQVFNDGDQTLSAFIRERRLARSRQALLRPAYADFSITQISYACGFSCSAHFSRAFREKFGMSPRAYRKRYHAGAETCDEAARRGR